MRAAFLKIVLLSLPVVCSLLFPSFTYGKVSYVTLPAFSTSKNEGPSYGNLTAFLFKNEEGEVTAILAPLFLYNKIFGFKGAVNLFGYLPGDQDYKIVLSLSSRIEKKAVLQYKDPSFWGGHLGVEADAIFFKDATYRFFGFTQQSREADETNFSQKELLGRLSLGFNLTSTMRLSLEERVRRVRVFTGGVEDLPFIEVLFPDLPGLEGAELVAHRLNFLYDSRDDRTTTTSGDFLEAYAEFVNPLPQGGSPPFTRYSIDVRTWHPFQEKRFILAGRLKMGFTGGSGLPFFERSALGGETTLRAFGQNRFIDDNLIVMSLEGRIEIFKARFLGVVSEWQLTPFVDMGRVFSSVRRGFFEHYQANPGVGLRALVRPNVVGRADAGFGPEGPTVFMGIEFPF